MRTAPGTRDANGSFVRVRVERRCRVISGLRFSEDAGRGHEHAVASARAPHYASSGTPTSRIGVATMIAATAPILPARRPNPCGEKSWLAAIPPTAAGVARIAARNPTGRTLAVSYTHLRAHE